VKDQYVLAFVSRQAITTHKTVMNTANHNSCALSSELASDLHSPRLMSYVLPRTTKTQVAWQPSVISSTPIQGSHVPRYPAIR
jgi:hypothetical protein